MDIDALDPAAGLPRVEEGAVNKVLNGMVEVRVGAHVGWVLAAELQTHADETAGGGALDGGPCRNRAREGDVIDPRILDDAGGRLMGEVKRLQQAVRQARLLGCRLHPLGAK